MIDDYHNVIPVEVKDYQINSGHNKRVLKRNDESQINKKSSNDKIKPQSKAIRKKNKFAFGPRVKVNEKSGKISSNPDFKI